MSYYDNLRGVMQTKLDALNAMDHFRNVANAGRHADPPATPLKPASPVTGMVLAGAAAVLAALACAAAEASRKK